MYTRCPHCTTIFQITAEQLRLAHGEMSCVTCTQSFNALESLADDVPTLITAGSHPVTEGPAVEGPVSEGEAILDGADTVVDPERDGVDPRDPRDDDETAREETLAPGVIDGDSVVDNDDGMSPDTTTEPEAVKQAWEDLVEGADSEPKDTGEAEEPESEAVAQAWEDLADGTDSEPEDTGEAEEPESEAVAQAWEDLADGTDSEPEDADESRPGAIEPAWEELADHSEENEGEGGDDDDTRDLPRPDLSDLEPEAADIAAFDDSLEFDAPEQTWTKYFLTDDVNVSPDRKANETDTDDGAFEHQTGDQSVWQKFLAELDDDPPVEATDIGPPSTVIETARADVEQSVFADPFDADDDDVETDDEERPSSLPPWLADEGPDELPQQGRRFLPSWPVLGAFTALTLLLAGQLIHYNRDALAAHPTYGGMVRGIYVALGTTLYPDWPLDAFEVSGTEAVSGRSNQNGLDILANVIVAARQPVGLPLIRIVLRDRWSNPVASRVFEPHEYLRTFDPANPLIGPGTALPVEVSVADPGSAAIGYIVDVCLPRRKTGLECQIARDPFQK